MTEPTPEQLARREQDRAEYRARSHDGKIPYRKDRAKRAARGWNAQYGGRSKVAYRCEFCGDWHIGTAK